MTSPCDSENLKCWVESGGRVHPDEAARRSFEVLKILNQSFPYSKIPPYGSIDGTLPFVFSNRMKDELNLLAHDVQPGHGTLFVHALRFWEESGGNVWEGDYKQEDENVFSVKVFMPLDVSEFSISFKSRKWNHTVYPFFFVDWLKNWSAETAPHPMIVANMVEHFVTIAESKFEKEKSQKLSVIDSTFAQLSRKGWYTEHNSLFQGKLRIGACIPSYMRGVVLTSNVSQGGLITDDVFLSENKWDYIPFKKCKKVDILEKRIEAFAKSLGF